MFLLVAALDLICTNVAWL